MEVVTKGFELIIFDCDGVLVDSEPIINRAHARVLTACGYSITEEALIERFCGMSDAEMLDIIEREWGRALPGFYAARVGEMIESGFRQSLAPIDSVAEFLDGLRLPRCVASSSVPQQIRNKLELAGLLTYFGDNLFLMFAFKRSDAIFRLRCSGGGRLIGAHSRRQGPKTPVEQALMRGLVTA